MIPPASWSLVSAPTRNESKGKTNGGPDSRVRPLCIQSSLAPTGLQADADERARPTCIARVPPLLSSSQRPKPRSYSAEAPIDGAAR